MQSSSLLRARRFLPLFCTQFLGAFNDNLLKTTLMILIAYSMSADQSAKLVPLCQALFVLPFVLFSAVAGQVTDKYEKSKVIRSIKLAEIFIMGTAAIGFITSNIPILVIVLFFLGTHSAFFGPAKYSILPQHLYPDELLRGNALVATATFISILLGTFIGGVAIAQKPAGPYYVAALVCILAILGYLTSRAIPEAPSVDPSLKIEKNPWRQAAKVFQLAGATPSLRAAMLGISWFWFFGSSVLVLIPTVTKNLIQGNEYVADFFLGLFCVGIGAGSALCVLFSRGRLKLGLVHLGSIGMTIVSIALFFCTQTFATVEKRSTLIGLSEFLALPRGQSLSLVLFLTAVVSSFYIVPLNTLIQKVSPEGQRSQVIAANNVLNAFFMVLSAIFLMTLSALHFSQNSAYLALGALNILFYLLLSWFLRRAKQ